MHHIKNGVALAGVNKKNESNIQKTRLQRTFCVEGR